MKQTIKTIKFSYNLICGCGSEEKHYEKTPTEINGIINCLLKDFNIIQNYQRIRSWNCIVCYKPMILSNIKIEGVIKIVI